MITILSFLFTETIGERLSKWNVITGLALAVIALILMVLSRTIVRKVFKNKTEEQQVAYALRFKIVAAVFAVAGLMMAVLIP